jgi:excisionase family DNA binding protein
MPLKGITATQSRVNLSPPGASLIEMNPPMSLADEIERIERALSVTEVARLLSLCRASVYRYIDAGIIPAIRIGTTLRVDPKALAQCLRRRALIPE